MVNASFAIVDAGRQPLATVQNVLNTALAVLAGDKGTVKNAFVDSQGLLDDSYSLATEPSTLQRVATINRIAGLAILAGRAPCPVSLRRVRTINRKAGREMLERRKAGAAVDTATISDDSTLCGYPVDIKQVVTVEGKAFHLVNVETTISDDTANYFDIKRAKLGLVPAAPTRSTVLEYPIIDFAKGTRIFTEKVSVRNIPVSLPTPEYEVRKVTRKIKFADERPEVLQLGGRWKQEATASSF